jgi:hypothetical protein
LLISAMPDDASPDDRATANAAAMRPPGASAGPAARHHRFFASEAGVSRLVRLFDVLAFGIAASVLFSFHIGGTLGGRWDLGLLCGGSAGDHADGLAALQVRPL